MQCQRQQIAERIDHLLTILNFQPEHFQELEQIDTQLTKLLLKADHDCCPKNNAPWSPVLNQAYLWHCYWSIAFTAHHNQRDMKDVLQSIKAKLIPSAEDQLEPTRSLLANLRHAQKNLGKEK